MRVQLRNPTTNRAPEPWGKATAGRRYNRQCRQAGGGGTEAQMG